MSAIDGIGRRTFVAALASAAGLAFGAGDAGVSTKQGQLQRLTVESTKSFEEVVAAFEGAVGHPNMAELTNQMNGARTFADLASAVDSAAAKSGLIQFARFDLGAVVRKENGLQTPKIIRYLVGNPLIMKEMVKHVPDAGSYAPVTVLIDERPDGVRLSYDKMAAFLAAYGNEDALKVARELDLKVETLLRQAAA